MPAPLRRLLEPLASRLRLSSGRDAAKTGAEPFLCPPRARPRCSPCPARRKPILPRPAAAKGTRMTTTTRSGGALSAASPRSAQQPSPVRCSPLRAARPPQPPQTRAVRSRAPLRRLPPAAPSTGWATLCAYALVTLVPGLSPVHEQARAQASLAAALAHATPARPRLLQMLRPPASLSFHSPHNSLRRSCAPHFPAAAAATPAAPLPLLPALRPALLHPRPLGRQPRRLGPPQAPALPAGARSPTHDVFPHPLPRLLSPSRLPASRAEPSRPHAIPPPPVPPQALFGTDDARVHLSHSEALHLSALGFLAVLSSSAALVSAVASGREAAAAAQPVLLYLAAPLLLLLPVDAFHLRPRRFFLATLWRMLAPAQPVSFADFLLADFLTSLAKSVSDVERAVCSMVTGPVLAAAADAMAEFRCGSASWHIPMALALPYLIRLSQCIRRASGAPPAARHHYNARRTRALSPPGESQQALIASLHLPSLGAAAGSTSTTRRSAPRWPTRPSTPPRSRSSRSPRSSTTCRSPSGPPSTGPSGSSPRW